MRKRVSTVVVTGYVGVYHVFSLESLTTNKPPSPPYFSFLVLLYFGFCVTK